MDNEKNRQLSSASQPDDIICEGFPEQGYGKIPRQHLRDPKVSMQAKGLWGMLEDFASPTSPEPFPGQEVLAEYAAVSVDTIKRWLKELKKAGWVSVRRRGFGKSNRYVLHWTPKKELSTGVKGVSPGRTISGTDALNDVGKSSPRSDHKWHTCTPISGMYAPLSKPMKQTILKTVLANSNVLEVESSGAEVGTPQRSTGEAHPIELCRGLLNGTTHPSDLPEEPLPEPTPKPKPKEDTHDDQARRCTAAIMTELGLAPTHRHTANVLVSQALARGVTPNDAFEAARGSMSGVTDVGAVLKHRIARAAPHGKHLAAP